MKRNKVVKKVAKEKIAKVAKKAPNKSAGRPAASEKKVQRPRARTIESSVAAENKDPDVITPQLVASVNGQVKDTAGNPWGFAVLQFSLFVPSGQVPIELSTGLRIPNPAPVVCDATGNFTTALQKTDSVVPDALWQLTIYPFNSQVAGQTLSRFQMVGPLNLSASIQAQLQPYSDPPLVLPMSNSSAIRQPDLNGAIYFDVETQKLMIRNPASQAYVSIGQVVETFPAEGVPVSNGSGWDSSIDPATLARIDSANTFTKSQTIQGNLIADSTTGYLDNAMTPAPVRMMIGLAILVNGVATVNFAKPFGAGKVYVFVSIIGSGGPGDTTTPGIWVFSANTDQIVIRASSTTASNGVFWQVFGSP